MTYFEEDCRQSSRSTYKTKCLNEDFCQISFLKGSCHQITLQGEDIFTDRHRTFPKKVTAKRLSRERLSPSRTLRKGWLPLQKKVLKRDSVARTHPLFSCETNPQNNSDFRGSLHFVDILVFKFPIVSKIFL